MNFIFEDWVYIVLNVPLTILLLLFSIVFTLKIKLYTLVVYILFLFFGPFYSILVSSVLGFRFNIILAVQFFAILILYLRTNPKLFIKNVPFVVKIFFLAIFSSTLTILIKNLLFSDIVELLRFISLGFLSAVNTYLITYYLVKVNLNLNNLLRKFSVFLVYYGTLIILEGLFNYLSGLSSFYSNIISHNNQLYTILGQGPDGISRILIVSTLCLFYVYRMRNALRIKNLIITIYLVFGPLIVFLTLSRTGLFLVMLMFFILISFSRLKYLWYSTYLILITVFINVANSLNYITENKSQEFNSMDTFFFRLDLLSSAYEIILSNWSSLIFGVGYRMYFPFILSLGGVERGGIIVENSSFENKFIELIIETGILGLFFVLLFLIQSFILIKNNMNKNNNLRYHAVAYSLILVGSLLVNMDWIVFYLFFFILLKNKQTTQNEFCS